jgi:hypothetical protein
VLAGLFLAHASGILQSIGGSVAAVDTLFTESAKGINFLKQKEAQRNLVRQTKKLHPVIVKK